MFFCRSTSLPEYEVICGAAHDKPVPVSGKRGNWKCSYSFNPFQSYRRSRSQLQRGFLMDGESEKSLQRREIERSIAKRIVERCSHRRQRNSAGKASNLDVAGRD